MKKITLTVALTTLLITLLLFALSLVSCAKENITYTGGEVLEVIGKARVHRNGGSLPAYKGVRLKHGDEIYTEVGANVMIVLGGNKYAIVEGDARVRLELYNTEENQIVRMVVSRGAVYTEADSPLAETEIFEVVTPDGVVSGGEAVFRVAISQAKGSKLRTTRVNSMKGVIDVRLSSADGESTAVTAWNECGIECDLGTEEALPRFTVKETATDIYSLPDRYIELNEDGVFDQSGNVIPKPKSTDCTLKEITVLDASGAPMKLFPEFSVSVQGYVVESVGLSEVTVTANHRKSLIEVISQGAISYHVSGNTAKVSFDPESSIGRAYVIGILVVAEDGTECRYSVTVVPPEQ